MWGISYWVFPVISGLSWLGMLIAMLVVWTTSGRPQYPSMEPGQTIAYISDVGAQGLKPLFIACSAVMAAFIDLALISERWLRHRGRLAHNTTTMEKVLSTLSILAALAGTVGIVCLTIFDTLRHDHLHDRFLIVFMVGYLLSAIFICWTYQRLGIKYREHRVLRSSFWIKLFFIIVEVALAIAFGICNSRDHLDEAAIIEWVIAFIFTFYILSFFIDLIPAVRRNGLASQETIMQRETEEEMQQSPYDGTDEEMQQAPYGGPNYRGDGSRLGQNF